MIAALLMVIAHSVSYQRCAAETDHRGFGKTQVLECATHDMDRADGALNATYRETLTRLTTVRQKQLRREERVWMVKRRAICLRAAREPISSPEINRMLCLVRETDVRTAYLKTID